MDIDIDTAIGIWTENRMSNRSGYYAGRGSLTCDLNSDLLERIYQGIKKDVGEEEAKNFVQMVDALEDMSATAFIVAFRQFGYNKFQGIVEQHEDDDIALSAQLHGDDTVNEGMSVLIQALANRSNRSSFFEHNNIKANFIRSHSSELSRKLHIEDTSMWMTRNGSFHNRHGL